ncbi:MAG: universal stress protein [Elusimicrobia bacterium]|nr:universal stress protein [Elusimicrobiota bacterium]
MPIHFPPRRILAAMDFSPAARSALAAAASLRALFRARLELVCVQEPEAIAVEPELMGVELGVSLRREKERTDLLRRRLRQAATTRGPAASRVFVGAPIDTLSRLAIPSRADLVVMGIHDSHDMGSAIFGTTSEAVVRRAQVPVLAVHRRRDPLKLRRLLCPVNLTPYSGRALAYAARLAEALGATLRALHVFHDGSDDEAWRSLKGFLRLTLGEAARGVETMVVRGAPREEIVRQAERGRCDLLVLCEHLRPWSADRLLGTTAELALRRTSIPVLAVPYGGPARPAEDAKEGLRFERRTGAFLL